MQKEQCCGCGACSNACKKKAISMLPDNEGFLYPAVNKELCNDCNLCKTVCPSLNLRDSLLGESQVYAAKNKDLQQRTNSSSGGMFPLIAGWALDNHYFVVGVGYDIIWQAEHQIIEDKTQLPRLCRSKYVQSNTRDIYQRIKSLLREGHKVLFSGTPCQCSALRLFLKKDYENLICVDVICHGVPSPMVWNKYLDEKSEEYGEDRAEIVDVQFKIKNPAKGYVWRRPGFCIRWKSGKEFSSFGNASSYENGFLGNLFVRPSCHQCKVKNISSGSDITIGDYWGCNEIMPDFDDIKGVSIIFLNTRKGDFVYSHIADSLISVKLTTQEAVFHNARITNSSMPHVNRKRFFHHIDENLDDVVPRMLRATFLQKKILRIKCIIKKYFPIA